MKWPIMAYALLMSITIDAMQLSQIPSPRENIPSSFSKKILHAILQKTGSYKNVKQNMVQKIPFQDDQQIEAPTNLTEFELKQRRKLISHLSNRINKTSINMAKEGQFYHDEDGSYEGANYSLKFLLRENKIVCFLDCPALSGLEDSNPPQTP